MSSVEALHPDLRAIFEPALALKAQVDPNTLTLETRRQNVKFAYDVGRTNVGEITGVSTTEYEATAPDGHKIKLFWVHKTEDQNAPKSSTPALVHFHGGGYISGSAEAGDALVADIVSRTGVPLLDVDYRLAPENPAPAAVTDGYAALTWLHEHANELNVDKTRIGVMGASAGGGLSAGVALYARDQGLQPPLSMQILGCPMLDDTNLKGQEIHEKVYAWSTSDNKFAWAAYLGGAQDENEKKSNIFPYAAPARATNLAGLPRTFLDVGSTDLFYAEDLEYAKRLIAAGVDVELHVYPGAPHAYELLGMNTPIAQRSRADRLRAVARL